MLHFWAPEIDPAHPMECTQPERYAIRRLDDGLFLAVQGTDQRVAPVADQAEAYLYQTHEAALRDAMQLNSTERGPVDVIKIEWEPAAPAEQASLRG